MCLDEAADPILKSGRNRHGALQYEGSFAGAAVAADYAGLAAWNPVVHQPAPGRDRLAFPLRSIERIERSDIMHLVAAVTVGFRSLAVVKQRLDFARQLVRKVFRQACLPRARHAAI